MVRGPADKPAGLAAPQPSHYGVGIVAHAAQHALPLPPGPASPVQPSGERLHSWSAVPATSPTYHLEAGVVPDPTCLSAGPLKTIDQPGKSVQQSKDPTEADDFSMFQGNLVLAGVGGQGIIMASNIISLACLESGLDAKKSEVHGMSQRGGTVVSHIRFGPEVHSVMLEPRQADWILGFEWEEGLRFLEYLKPGGVAFISTERRIPPGALADRLGGRIDYALEAAVPQGVVPVDAYAVAGEAAAARPAIAQTVLLGALSVDMGLSQETWREAIAAMVPPKTVEANLIAFENGRVWYERWKKTTGPQHAQARIFDQNKQPEGTSLGGTSFARSSNGTKTSVEDWRGGTPVVEVMRGWCKGCNICVVVCPERVLILDRFDIAVASNPDRCTGCGLCARLCPDMALEVWLEKPRISASAGNCEEQGTGDTTCD
ncbi:MAG: 2-oxoacid:acceptor oxidoreductase family protein [Acidimicrobiales bacterium]